MDGTGGASAVEGNANYLNHHSNNVGMGLGLSAGVQLGGVEHHSEVEGGPFHHRPATTEADYQKLLLKKQTYESHLKRVATIQPADRVCKDIIDFINSRVANDFLVDSTRNPFVATQDGGKCCAMM